MEHGPNCWLLYVAILFLVTIVQSAQARLRNENKLKTAEFLSPMFQLEPGSVINKNYYNIDFPRGHIGLKSFDAEVVDEAGNPVPLHETYLHHWLVIRYYGRKGVEVPPDSGGLGFHESDFILVRNSGLCDHGVSHYFGLGSETRKTATDVPDPYGIEVGNPAEIPIDYEERWLVNIHAIDTRGTVDRVGCTECRCDLYNITMDEYGRPLNPNYVGGLYCCYDETRCKVKEGFNGLKRNLYMRYKVNYVDWDSFVVPVKIYILDVTDNWRASNGVTSAHHCLIEYEVESCAAELTNENCIQDNNVSLRLPAGGDVVYAVAHQHAGGIGSTLYGEDGRVICSSLPIYGNGQEPGNEDGYIVGMSTCYPRPGSVKISSGETLSLVSQYSSARRHTGVMGLFYILVADSSPNHIALQAPDQVHEKVMLGSIWGLLLSGVALLVVVAATYRLRFEGNNSYEPIAM